MGPSVIVCLVKACWYEAREEGERGKHRKVCQSLTLTFPNFWAKLTTVMHWTFLQYLPYISCVIFFFRGWCCFPWFVRSQQYNYRNKQYKYWITHYTSCCQTLKRRLLPKRQLLCWWSLDRKWRSLWTLLLYERRYCLCCWTLYG